MNKFNWLKAVGFGIMIWGIMALVLTVLTSINVMSAGWAHGITAIVFGLAAFLFATNAKPAGVGQAFGYGAIWVAIGLLLDAVVMRHFDAHIFTSWQYWAGYALVLLAPWAQIERHTTITHAV